MVILLPAGVIVTIRNFFFPDMASAHTYRSESGIRIRSFLNPFPEGPFIFYEVGGAGGIEGGGLSKKNWR